MTLYLNDMGVISPLGTGKAQVLENLLAGATAGMERATHSETRSSCDDSQPPSTTSAAIAA